MAGSRHEKVQEALERVVAEGSAPGAVAEIQDENGTWFGSAGVADLETGRRRDPGDRFHTGSISKAFTAAALLTLEAEGSLSLDDTVDKWLPGVVRGNGNDGSSMTIRQLLSNTSGLGMTGLSPEIVRRYHTRSGFAENRFYVWTVDELLRLQLSIPPVFAPGEGFAYSNGGFQIAGAIIEKATGRTYVDEIDRTVIQPLGLTNTYAQTLDEWQFRGQHCKAYSKGLFVRDDVDPDTLTAENYTSLLEGTDGDPLDITDRTYFEGAAGCVVSTTGDLLRVAEALITGSLLPPAQHRAMWTTGLTTDWIPNARYGLGVSQWPLADGRLAHVLSGMTGGTACVTLGTSDGELIVSMHVNGDWNWYMACYQIAEAAFGSPFLVTQ
ncbi:serine hydrolase domain-containing protein [Saccharopolyspora elongata]|uniref:Class A beta-lactamase-related serine hydrolase n=1 Tax=Saccharopolyspora elongata TaxID=2530387 RepID=A0A4R4YEK4_9PSEU|nr:serine hydrolase domain-containing protein [Saccharopolyspora elongata]TDD41642.1 class A beta-lactamase-related serine hydrolase [Saccharopolyspora elongata]